MNRFDIDQFPDLQILGVSAVLKLEYDTPLKIPPYTAAIAKTNQTNSVLSVANISAKNEATYVVNPDPHKKEVYHLAPNNKVPAIFKNDWNGAILKVSNISTQSATIKVFLT